MFLFHPYKRCDRNESLMVYGTTCVWLPYIPLHPVFFKNATKEKIPKPTLEWSSVFIELNIARKGQKYVIMIQNMVIFDTTSIRTYLFRNESSYRKNEFIYKIHFTPLREIIKTVKNSWLWVQQCSQSSISCLPCSSPDPPPVWWGGTFSCCSSAILFSY